VGALFFASRMHMPDFRAPKDPIRSLPSGVLPPPGAIAVSLVERSDGLLVPDYLVNNAPDDAPARWPVMMQYSAINAGWKEVTGTLATLAGVVDRLRRYSLPQVLTMVSRHTMALSLERPYGENVLTGQRRVLARMVGDELADQIVARVKATLGSRFDPDRVMFFQERQTLNTLKLAFLAIDLDAPDGTETSAVPFVEALFMVSNLMDEPYDSFDVSTETGRCQMELYVAASMLFNEGPVDLHDFVRAHYLYTEPHTDIDRPGLVDVPAALERATGLSASTVWFALYGLYCGLNRTLADLDAGRVFLPANYFAALSELPPNIRARWLALAAQDIADLHARIRADYSLEAPRYFDVLPFEERPLVAVGPTLYCASRPLYQRLAGVSLQHRLLNRSVFNDQERHDFLDTRGHLVEHYTNELLTRCFGARFIPERLLKERAGEDASVCDGIIIYPDALILVEDKTSSPLLQTRHAEDYDAYRKKWGGVVRKAADQFEATISLIRSGIFAELGIDAGIRDLYPVVGVFEQVITPLTYRAILRDVLSGHPLGKRIEDRSVAPLQIHNIHDFELWEIAIESGHSILDLLRAKTANPEYAELPLQNFVHSRWKPLARGRSRWHEARFGELAAQAMAFFKSLGMPHGARGAADR